MMEKTLDIRVEKDHLLSLTKASAKTAIAELIWNSLDADAKSIDVIMLRNPLGIESIEVKDDGHGIDLADAEHIFGTLGGSIKKDKHYSPLNRAYHGKEGKGRFKAMAIGSLVSFISAYRASSALKSFKVTWDESNLNHPTMHEISSNGLSHPGLTVRIENIKQDRVGDLSSDNCRHELEVEFAVYYLAYNDFSICFDGWDLDFEHLIKASKSHQLRTSSDVEYEVRIVEWTINIERRLHLCGNQGVTFLTDRLGIRAGEYPISVYVMSSYVESLHREVRLTLAEMDPTLAEMLDTAKQWAKDYIRTRMHESAFDYIEGLKRENLYPYKEPSSNVVEEAERQVFDIVALHINEYLPNFTEQDSANKKFTFALVKEALENDTSGLQKILTEVVTLPKKKVEELNEILEKTTLTTIIDIFKEITERLTTINELRLLLFDDRFKKSVLERRHLHKIVREETWIFGDDYTYGADDVNLKNVLKTYLGDLGRAEFEDIMNKEADGKLDDIPDICLWKQYNKGSAGYYRNLIIELKRPSKTIGTKEIEQIKKYARAVSADSRFPKEKTDWVFILLVTEINAEGDFDCKQKNRKYGHVHEDEHINVYVLKWGDVLNEAESRHQYLKDKINSNMNEGEEGIVLLRKKYAKFLPKSIVDDENNQTTDSTLPNFLGEAD